MRHLLKMASVVRVDLGSLRLKYDLGEVRLEGGCPARLNEVRKGLFGEVRKVRWWAPCSTLWNASLAPLPTRYSTT